MLVTTGTTIHCNRCHKAFEAPKSLDRQPFAGESAARLEMPCTCPYCQQTDWHWFYADDVIPKFDGGFDARKRARLQWLLNN